MKIKMTKQIKCLILFSVMILMNITQIHAETLINTTAPWIPNTNGTTVTNSDGSVTMTRPDETGYKFLFIRLSQTGRGGALNRDLIAGEKITVKIRAKSSSTKSWIMSKFLDFKSKTFKKENVYEDFIFETTVKANISPYAWLGLFLEKTGDTVTVKSIEILDGDTDITPPVITIKGANPLNLKIGDSYTELGATAIDELDGDVSASIIIGGDTVDTNTAGTYTITYTASDEKENKSTRNRIVIVSDTGVTPPLGDNLLISKDPWIPNTKNSTKTNTDGSVTMTRPNETGYKFLSVRLSKTGRGGALSRDLEAGEKIILKVSAKSSSTKSWIMSKFLDFKSRTFKKENVYEDFIFETTVKANISPYAWLGLFLEKTGDTVTVKSIKILDGDTPPSDDTTPPTITLKGENLLTLKIGDTYTEAGATALDDVDGDVSASIVIGGDTVDTSKVGSYLVSYTVSDKKGNKAVEVSRTVNVSTTTGSPSTGEELIIGGAQNNLDTSKWTLIMSEGAIDKDNCLPNKHCILVNPYEVNAGMYQAIPTKKGKTYKVIVSLIGANHYTDINNYTLGSSYITVDYTLPTVSGTSAKKSIKVIGDSPTTVEITFTAVGTTSYISLRGDTEYYYPHALSISVKEIGGMSLPDFVKPAGDIFPFSEGDKLMRVIQDKDLHNNVYYLEDVDGVPDGLEEDERKRWKSKSRRAVDNRITAYDQEYLKLTNNETTSWIKRNFRERITYNLKVDEQVNRTEVVSNFSNIYSLNNLDWHVRYENIQITKEFLDNTSMLTLLQLKQNTHLYNPIIMLRWGKANYNSNTGTTSKNLSISLCTAIDSCNKASALFPLINENDFKSILFSKEKFYMGLHIRKDKSPRKYDLYTKYGDSRKNRLDYNGKLAYPNWDEPSKYEFSVYIYCPKLNILKTKTLQMPPVYNNWTRRMFVTAGMYTSYKENDFRNINLEITGANLSY